MTLGDSALMCLQGEVNLYFVMVSKQEEPTCSALAGRDEDSNTLLLTSHLELKVVHNNLGLFEFTA